MERRTREEREDGAGTEPAPERIERIERLTELHDRLDRLRGQGIAAAKPFQRMVTWMQGTFAIIFVATGIVALSVGGPAVGLPFILMGVLLGLLWLRLVTTNEREEAEMRRLEEEIDRILDSPIEGGGSGADSRSP